MENQYINAHQDPLQIETPPPPLIESTEKQQLSYDAYGEVSSYDKGQFEPDSDTSQGIKRGLEFEHEGDQLVQLTELMDKDHCHSYIESLVFGWAYGHWYSGDMFNQEEILVMCTLANTTPRELALLAESLGLKLQKIAKKNNGEMVLWQVISSNTVSATSPASPPNNMLSGLVSSLPRFLLMYRDQQKDNTGHGHVELKKSEKAEIAKLATMAFKSGVRLSDGSKVCTGTITPIAAAAAVWLISGSEPQSTAQLDSVHRVWSAEIDRLYGLAARKAMQPERRSLRRATMQPVDYHEVNNLPIDNFDFVQPPAKKPRSVALKLVKANKLSTEEKKPKETGPQPINIPLPALQLSAKDHMLKLNVTKRIESSDNCPDPSLLMRQDFIPLIFSAVNAEPSHCIVAPRVSKVEVRKRPQAQGHNEYDVSGFPMPVNPVEWLKLQQDKYKCWLDRVRAFKSLKIINEVQKRRCHSVLPLGIYSCTSCINKQTDDECRFVNSRAVTKMDIVLRNGAEITRYILAPMFLSQPSVNCPLLISPLEVSEELLSKFQSNPGSAECSDMWFEFYSLYLTAPTLLAELKPISAIVCVDASKPGASVNCGSKKIEYGVHPQLGCSEAPCVYQEATIGRRQFCDNCSTSMLAAYFGCCMCAQELCPKCFVEWNDSVNGDERVYVITKPSKPDDASAKEKTAQSTPSILGKYKRINHCKRMVRQQAMFGALHKRCQFVRVSLVLPMDIESIMGKAQSVLDMGTPFVKPGFDSAGILDNAQMACFKQKIGRIQQRTRQLYNHEEWELPVVYVAPDELSVAEFSQLWRQGVVVVVRDLLHKLDSTIWKPDWWISNFGYEMVTILDCAKGTHPAGDGQWPLRDFYRLFDGSDDGYAHMFDAEMEKASDWYLHRKCVESGILKLKDWPPTDDFSSILPEHFQRFMDALPFPEYTRRNGRCNLVNRLPEEYVPPDLGPKMYCAYGSSDREGGVGTTNLHCDMADAVNIMAYASKDFLRRNNIDTPGIWTRGVDDTSTASAAASLPSSATAAAVWDIYPPEAVVNLRKYIHKKEGRTDNYFESVNPMSDSMNRFGDPIHNQSTFLTRSQRQEIYNIYGNSGAGSCYRVSQNPGDAVFIPAGCAHQVCNYASAVKIAMDFVSPERVQYSSQLTQEFRQLYASHPRKSDLLQLSNILWWTFAGDQRRDKKKRSNSKPKQSLV